MKHIFSMKRIFFSLFVLLPLLAGAQYTGRVVDEQEKPVPYANVVLLSLPDSAVLSSALTAEDGIFTLPSHEKGGLLRISLVGYSIIYNKVTGVRQTFGDLRLMPDMAASTLNEATVTAQRPVVRMVGGALVTNVEGSTLSKSGTAEDVLAHVPGIVKKDENFEVVGKGTPVIYINGRPVRDPEELKQLKSDEIKSVEVVRNPGARYDATVGSVVRIRTVRRQGEGFSVDATVGYAQGRYARPNSQLKLNYRQGALDVFLGADYWVGRSLWESDLTQENRVDTLWQQTNHEGGTTDYRSYALTGGFNYDISERHAIGLRYQMSKNLKLIGNSWFTSDVMANGVYYDRLDNDIITNRYNEPVHALNAYYVGQIGKGELNVEADFHASGGLNRQTTVEHSAEHEDRVVPSDNDVSNRLVAAKAEYGFPLWWGKFTVGTHYTFTDRNDDYIVPQNDFGVSTSRSRLKEQNVAGFVEFSRAAKIGQISAGLRYEHVVFDYYSAGEYRPEQSRTFDNLFPGISLATQLGKMQLMAAYTAKTRRPNYNQLSNSVTYGNRFTLQVGNPHLKPTITHDVTLTGVWKFLTGVLTWQHQKDAIIFWGTPLPDRPSATLISHTNDDITNLTAVFTAAPKLGFWQPTATAVLQHQFYKKTVVDGEKAFDRPLFVGTLNNAFTLPAGFVLNVDYNFQSRGNYQNVYLAGEAHALNVSLQKSFLDNALSVTLQGNDLLHRQSGLAKVYMQNAVATQKSWSDSRQFSITLRYKFNATRSKYRGQGAAAGEIKRL